MAWTRTEPIEGGRIATFEVLAVIRQLRTMSEYSRLLLENGLVALDYFGRYESEIIERLFSRLDSSGAAPRRHGEMAQIDGAHPS